MNELRILLAADYTVHLRVTPEGPIELVLSRGDEPATETLRSTVITGLDPDVEHEVETIMANTVDEALRAAAAVCTARRPRTHAIRDVYKRFKHLDSALRSGAQATDPIYQACAAMWEAISSDRTEAS